MNLLLPFFETYQQCILRVDNHHALDANRGYQSFGAEYQGILRVERQM